MRQINVSNTEFPVYVNKYVDDEIERKWKLNQDGGDQMDKMASLISWARQRMQIIGNNNHSLSRRVRGYSGYQTDVNGAVRLWYQMYVDDENNAYFVIEDIEWIYPPRSVMWRNVRENKQTDDLTIESIVRNVIQELLTKQRCLGRQRPNRVRNH